MSEETKLFADKASQEIYEKAKRDSVSTVFSKAAELKPCPIGSAGDCCKHCGMGPCRVPEPKTAGAVRKVGRRATGPITRRSCHQASGAKCTNS